MIFFSKFLAKIQEMVDKWQGHENSFNKNLHTLRANTLIAGVVKRLKFAILIIINFQK